MICSLIYHLFPKRIRHGGSADGHTGVAALGLLDGVRSQNADCRDRLLFDVLHDILRV